MGHAEETGETGQFPGVTPKTGRGAALADIGLRLVSEYFFFTRQVRFPQGKSGWTNH